MKTGDIVLTPFPFTDLTQRKVRPAVVVCETADKYRDVVLCAISSVVPPQPSRNEHVIKADAQNGLRKESVVKVDRIVTAKIGDVITQIGAMSQNDLVRLKSIFQKLIENDMQ
ncbi:MAG: type II toxin-antitoxin system PemK/MazF family toxin [Acidobacteria bacterium]|nr:type II toxin-antitoxin system PemK/MazF family toxin [Acidobacteriota bacterium]